MEKMKVFQKEDSRDTDGYMHVKNGVSFKHKTKTKECKIESVDTAECLQGLPIMGRSLSAPDGSSSSNQGATQIGSSEICESGISDLETACSCQSYPSDEAISLQPSRHVESRKENRKLLLSQPRKNQVSTNYDLDILMLKLLQGNVRMIHNITEQQIMLRYRQAEITAISLGLPVPKIEEVISLSNNFTSEQLEAFERLVVRFDSTLPNLRRNLMIFIKDHPWLLDAEIKCFKNSINVEECNLQEDSKLKPDITVLMSSLFGRMNLDSI